MIRFNRKPGLFHEWGILGFMKNGLPKRKNLRNLKVVIDISYDNGSADQVKPLVAAFNGLFDGEVIGPDDKPMKLGLFGKVDNAPTSMPEAFKVSMTRNHLKELLPEGDSTLVLLPWWKRLLRIGE